MLTRDKYLSGLLAGIIFFTIGPALAHEGTSHVRVIQLVAQDGTSSSGQVQVSRVIQRPNHPTLPGQLTYIFDFEVRIFNTFAFSVNDAEREIQAGLFYALYVTALGRTIRLQSFASSTLGGGEQQRVATLFDLFPNLDFDNDLILAEVVEESDDGVDACNEFTGCPAAVVVLSGF